MRGKSLLKTAIFGLLISFIVSTVSVSVAETAVSSWRGNNFYTSIFSLLGFWTGLFGTCLYALRLYPGNETSGIPVPSDEANGSDPTGLGKSGGRRVKSLLSLLSENYGLRFRPAIDLPLGIVAGILAQLYLVAVFSWPLSFFVRNLSRRMSGPAKHLVSGLSGTEIVVLGIFICLFSPLFEELFFRGLLQRSLLEISAPFGRVFSVAVSILLTAAVFGSAHFESLQLLPLFGFGIMLGLAAYFTRRLGLGIAAHISFNTVAYVAIARGHF